MGANFHTNYLLKDTLVLDVTIFQGQHFHMSFQFSQFFILFESIDSDKNGYSKSAQISFLGTKWGFFKWAPQIYHLLIIFVTVLRTLAKSFKFLLNHWRIMQWKVYMVGTHQLGEKDWLVNLGQKRGRTLVKKLWRSSHKHRKLKEPERAETKVAWGICVAGTDKNSFLRVVLSGNSVACLDHKHICPRGKDALIDSFIKRENGCPPRTSEVLEQEIEVGHSPQPLGDSSPGVPSCI